MRKLLRTLPLLVVAMAVFAGPAGAAVDYDTGYYYDAEMARSLFDD